MPAMTEDDEDVVRAAASAAEVLRHRDVASLDAAEKRRLAAMFVRLSLRPPSRRTARHRRWHRGEIDASRTLRNSLRHLGEPGDIAWRRRGTRPRRVVLLVDVSGSMSGYADALLRLSHRLTQSARDRGGTVETFTVGTRLTHVTRALRSRDADRAHRRRRRGRARLVRRHPARRDAAGVPRPLGPARHGARRRGRRLQRRLGARGRDAARASRWPGCSRIAHRVIWVNPHRGKAGYEPLQGGVVAALPHCDDFLAGHSLATFADLTEVIARA